MKSRTNRWFLVALGLVAAAAIAGRMFATIRRQEIASAVEEAVEETIAEARAPEPKSQPVP